MKQKPRPTVYLVAGPNGAGKTTFASKFLPGFVKCKEFLNADLIASGLSPFAPETQNIRAGRLLLERIQELVAERRTFGFETTLSGLSYVKLLGNMKNDGYRIATFFLWLPSADIAVLRVANRVRSGGHIVPEEDVRRRYAAGMRNLFHLYLPLINSMWLCDASTLPPKIIANYEAGLWRLAQTDLFHQIERSVEKSHE